MQLSIVIPAFNESDGIVHFLTSLKNVVAQLQNSYEVIVVNDGSTDATLKKLLAFDWPEIVVVDLVANSGHMPALEAGLRASKGDLVITMDADLQHPVEYIPRMIDIHFATGCDVVVGVRDRGSETSWLRKKASLNFYKLLSQISRFTIEENAADFRLLTRPTLNQILNSPELTKIFRFLISDYGFKIETFHFSSPQRIYGESKYNYRALLRLATQSVLGFSTAPLTAISVGGVIFLAIAVFYTSFVMIAYFLGRSTPGWTSIMLFLTFFSSLQFIALGIIGRYLVEILREIRRRPSYLVRHVYKRGQTD